MIVIVIGQVVNSENEKVKGERLKLKASSRCEFFSQASRSDVMSMVPANEKAAMQTVASH
jgi:hypothetical protein